MKLPFLNRPSILKRRKKRRDLVTKVIKGKTVVIQSEELTQKKYFDWLEYERPTAREYCFAIANGGSRHILEAINLKRQGVTAGVPDVFHSIPSGIYHGLYIEFKREDVPKLKAAQEKKFELFQGVGYRCEMCNTLQKAKDVFDDYIGASEFLKKQAGNVQ